MALTPRKLNSYTMFKLPSAYLCGVRTKHIEVLKKAIQTGEGQTLWMQSVGVNEDGIVVSTFNFEWSVKVKS